MIRNLNILADICLSFSHATIIIPIILIGFWLNKGGEKNKITHDKVVFWSMLSLTILFTMIFNVFLKSLFLIPLNPLLQKDGFAFPSGHMQVSVVFYGMLFLAYSHNLVRGFFLLIMLGIAYGLIYKGYHTPLDIAGAFATGTFTLWAVVKGISLPFINKNPARFGLCLIFITALLIVGIHYRIGISLFVVKTFASLVTLSFLWLFYSNASQKTVF